MEAHKCIRIGPPTRTPDSDIQGVCFSCSRGISSSMTSFPEAIGRGDNHRRDLRGERPTASTSGHKISPKVVRVYFDDVDATDSSSDEGDGHVCRLRVKKHVLEIKIATPPARPPVRKRRRLTRICWKEEKPEGRTQKFRGVRRRPWGRWAAEIRDPTSRRRLWLGSFDTAEEAASVYDDAAVKLKGPNAITNFSKNPTPLVSSPKSILPPSLSDPGYIDKNPFESDSESIEIRSVSAGLEPFDDAFDAFSWPLPFFSDVAWRATHYDGFGELDDLLLHQIEDFHPSSSP